MTTNGFPPEWQAILRIPLEGAAAFLHLPAAPALCIGTGPAAAGDKVKHQQQEQEQFDSFPSASVPLPFLCFHFSFTYAGQAVDLIQSSPVQAKSIDSSLVPVRPNHSQIPHTHPHRIASHPRSEPTQPNQTRG
ncbi:hypothetical protein CPLU01_13474 [Colletotrichum plurivorum]|uniref:Uncharacterized protein n=1 Tax=Colletotrichum plurivorum TaxID=2175906 RepID=A0A8H6JSF8_9PEZI|nr:hypothetical protein CPLU01_13474 [Colletotrichum plurivorum]